MASHHTRSPSVSVNQYLATSFSYDSLPHTSALPHRGYMATSLVSTCPWFAQVRDNKNACPRVYISFHPVNTSAFWLTRWLQSAKGAKRQQEREPVCGSERAAKQRLQGGAESRREAAGSRPWVADTNLLRIYKVCAIA